MRANPSRQQHVGIARWCYGTLLQSGVHDVSSNPLSCGWRRAIPWWLAPPWGPQGSKIASRCSKGSCLPAVCLAFPGTSGFGRAKSIAYFVFSITQASFRLCLAIIFLIFGHEIPICVSHIATSLSVVAPPRLCHLCGVPHMPQSPPSWIWPTPLIGRKTGSWYPVP